MLFQTRKKKRDQLDNANTGVQKSIMKERIVYTGTFLSTTFIEKRCFAADTGWGHYSDVSRCCLSSCFWYCTETHARVGFVLFRELTDVLCTVRAMSILTNLQARRITQDTVLVHIPMCWWKTTTRQVRTLCLPQQHIYAMDPHDRMLSHSGTLILVISV